MKKLVWLFLSGFLFASCSKEASFERISERPSDKELLVKFVAKAEGASDSVVTTFAYNSNKRLTNVFSTTVGMVSGQYSESETKYYRDNKNRITRIESVQKTRDINTVQYADSLIYNVYFDDAGHYTYAIREVQDEPGKPILDSIAYKYDEKGRIGSVVAWRKDELNGNRIFEFQKTIYTYDGRGNIVVMSITFKDNINTSDPAQILNLSYGDKSSALNLGADGLLEGFIAYGLNSPNNVVLVDNPDIHQRYSYTYEFNANGMPVKSVETDMLSNKTTSISYYYK